MPASAEKVLTAIRNPATLDVAEDERGYGTVKHSVWESVEVTEPEMDALIYALVDNGIFGLPFTAEQVMRLLAYRRMIRRGLFNEGFGR